MKNTTPTMSRSIENGTGAVVNGKALKCLFDAEIVDDIPVPESRYSFSACGSGGGCSGGFDRVARARM